MALIVGAPAIASGQGAPGGGPVAVGIVRAKFQPVTETSQFIGRIQAPDRVNIVARVTGFLEKMFFVEGTEVKKGDLLYRIEQPPYQADVAAKQAAVEQLQAQLQNARLTLDRAKALLGGPAGQQSVYDNALAAERSAAAQVMAAQAQLRQAQINLDYTEIRSPINGRIGRTSITEGNVVGLSSGTLTTIVSQDPMYVVFPVSVRTALELQQRYLPKGGFDAVVIRITLSDGTNYPVTGKLNFADNTVSTETDTVILRGTIANPILPASSKDSRAGRQLIDGQFVTVNLEGAKPVEVLAIPRGAVISDIQGDYVYIVDADNKAQRRNVRLGQSTPSTAFVQDGLNEGDPVIVEGLQRVRPGVVVQAGPAADQQQVGTQ